jgi:hypothetical protein
MFATPAIYMSVNVPPAADKVSFAITGGSDAKRFEIAPDSGAVSLKKIPDSENSSGGAATNTYDFEVTATVAPRTEAKEFSVWSWIRDILQLNPMNGIISSFRSALLGHPIPWSDLSLSAIMVVAGFLIGCFYFYRLEPSFADII